MSTSGSKYKSKFSHSRGKICIECYNLKQKIKKRTLLKKYFVNMRNKENKSHIENNFGMI